MASPQLAITKELWMILKATAPSALPLHQRGAWHSFHSVLYSQGVGDKGLGYFARYLCIGQSQCDERGSHDVGSEA
jgi:hypothetical protein